MPSLKYIKTKEVPPTDWISKEKRELFCKAVNSYLMEGDHTTDVAILEAKKIIDKAFEFYPDTQPEEEISEEEMPL